MTDRSGKKLKDNSLWWVLFYTALGSSWILASDLWLFRSEENPGYRIISIAKGLAYVLITAMILYAMMRQNSGSFRRLAKNLLNSENRLRRIFDTAEEGLVVIGEDFKIRDVNSRFCTMLSLPVDQIVGTDFLTLLAPASREVLRSQIEGSHRDRRNLTDIEMSVQSEVYWLQASWSNFDDEDQKSYVFLLSDISHRIQKERLIADQNVELERRVGERTHQLEAVNSELTAFSYSVSHDLREPIRAINGLSHILIEDYKEDQKPEAQAIIDRILRNSMRMNAMIDGLLKLSRLTNTPLATSNVSLTELANKAFEESVPEDAQKTIAWNSQIGLQDTCDPNMMGIALQNLIGNAWKHNKDKQDLTIEFGCRDIDGVKSYYVRDNGTGFRQDKANDIFKPFVRLNMEIEGEGIGLATVQRIILRHKGRLWVESVPGKGCTFWFTIGSTLLSDS